MSDAVPAAPTRRPSLSSWVAGARPRTLAAAAVPVVVGTAAAWAQLHPGGVVLVHCAPHAVCSKAPVPRAGRPLIWWRAVAALVVALGIQVGTNYANDYSDGVRGTDAARVGPTRLVASGLARPEAVRLAALFSFLLAAVAGLALAAATSWWLVVVGGACMLAGWLYTGGPKPYGYLGLGELFVFVFFGLVATVGSAYVQTGGFGWLPVLAAIPVGLVATALLEANNLRDIRGDAIAHKRTLAVRLGEDRARWLYVGALVGAGAGVLAVAVLRPGALVGLLAAPLALGPVRAVRRGARGPALLKVLGFTGRLQVVGGLLLAVGIVLA
jgi:1,4-dihydroxy-2-naphthoate octaprenyltransferase